MYTSFFFFTLASGSQEWLESDFNLDSARVYTLVKGMEILNFVRRKKKKEKLIKL